MRSNRRSARCRHDRLDALTLERTGRQGDGEWCDDAAIAEVLALDQERCRAISEQEWDALSALLADDLTHSHMTGVTQDKPTHLAHVQQNPRRVERHDVTVRVYGDAAVVTGPQVNIVETDGTATEQAIETL